jgi:beta-lactamase superfamily II metal-dependent hydrolase
MVRPLGAGVNIAAPYARRCRAVFALLAALTLAAAAACSSSSEPTASGIPPIITVQGVAEGQTYDAPVAITIRVDRGAYAATLDDQPFLSGSTVAMPGAHTLDVIARASVVDTAAAHVHFTIAAPSGGALIIRMFDLGANEAGGGGDAILLTDSSAAGVTNVMIDAGPAGVNATDPGYVERQLAALHVDTLALLLLTHAHSDHYAGMPPVLSVAHVQRFVYNGQVRSLSSYTSVVAQARTVADSVIVVNANRAYDLGHSATPAHLVVLPPLPTYLGTDTDSGTLLNDGSVGAHLSLGTFTMFFTGDSEVEATARWRTQFAAFTTNVSVLKVGHHGANNAIFDNGFSGASAWLTQTSPEVSIISANGTTHPRINALNRLLSQPGDRTYCTNVHGTIELRVSRSGSYTVRVQRNADRDCVPGSEATT